MRWSVLDSVGKNAPGALVHLEALRASSPRKGSRFVNAGFTSVVAIWCTPNRLRGVNQAPAAAGPFIILSHRSYHSYVRWIKAARRTGRCQTLVERADCAPGGHTSASFPPFLA